jgi:hypothetical protein
MSNSFNKFTLLPQEWLVFKVAQVELGFTILADLMQSRKEEGVGYHARTGM